MEIQTIELQDLKKRILAMDFKVLRLNSKFSMDKISSIHQNITEKFEFKCKDNYPNYKAIGLHYSDVENPLYDCIEQANFITKENKVHFKKASVPKLMRNEIGEKFIFIEDHFPDLKLLRGRILVAEPGFRMEEHRDGPQTCTLHVPIVSNPGAKVVVDGEEFHLPADGSAYILNSELPHYAYNKSSEARTHLAYNITPFSFKSLTEKDIETFERYFKFYIRYALIPQVPWIEVK